MELFDITDIIKDYINKELKKKEEKYFKFKKDSEVLEDTKDFIDRAMGEARDYIKNEPELKLNCIEMEGYLRACLTFQNHIKEIESYIEEGESSSSITIFN